MLKPTDFLFSNKIKYSKIITHYKVNSSYFVLAYKTKFISSVKSYPLGNTEQPLPSVVYDFMGVMLYSWKSNLGITLTQLPRLS